MPAVTVSDLTVLPRVGLPTDRSYDYPSPTGAADATACGGQ